MRDRRSDHNIRSSKQINCSFFFCVKISKCMLCSCAMVVLVVVFWILFCWWSYVIIYAYFFIYVLREYLRSVCTVIYCIVRDFHFSIFSAIMCLFDQFTMRRPFEPKLFKRNDILDFRFFLEVNDSKFLQHVTILKVWILRFATKASSYLHFWVAVKLFRWCMV